MPHTFTRDPQAGFPHIDLDLVDDPALLASLNRIVDRTVDDWLAAEVQPDRMFGPLGTVIARSHLAYLHDGRLVEALLRAVCAHCPHLRLVDLARPFPIVPAAIEALRRNDWDALEGIALDGEVYADATYMPDVVVAEMESRTVHLLEIKRQVDNKRKRIQPVLDKLMASALVAPDWLARQARLRGIASVRVAVLDASGGAEDTGRGVLPLSAVDGLLAIPGATASIGAMRRDFHARVADELGRMLREAIGQRAEAGSVRPAEADAVDRPRRARTPVEAHPEPVAGRPVRFGFAACAAALDGRRH